MIDLFSFAFGFLIGFSIISVYFLHELLFGGGLNE